MNFGLPSVGIDYPLSLKKARRSKVKAERRYGLTVIVYLNRKDGPEKQASRFTGQAKHAKGLLGWFVSLL